jgi:phage terminase small subunit
VSDRPIGVSAFMPEPRPLNERERRFVDAYMGEAAGNATKAALIAGYGKASAHVTGCRLLKKPKISAAVAKDRNAEITAAISDRKERQEFLTKVHRGDVSGASVRDRIKAIEILSKTQGDYVPDEKPPAVQVNILAALPVDTLRAIVQVARQ